MSSSVANDAKKQRMLPPSLTCSPTLSLVPPGKCQFTSDFQSVPLLERTPVSSTSSVLKFGLPDDTKPLNLSTCACILAMADLSVSENMDGKEETDAEQTATEAVIRPYTPISTNKQVGSFDLLVKHYDKGKMSGHMRTMPIGSTLDFKHIDFNVKIQAPFKQKKIGMIVGGTGITPMIQALHAILGDAKSATHVSMLYGSKVSTDILGQEMLSKWAGEHGDRLSVTHVLSDEPKESEWKGERGFITKDLIKKHFPGPDLGSDAIVFVCGPPPMYNIMCGPREEKEVKGVLFDLGYNEDQVYKF